MSTYFTNIGIQDFASKLGGLTSLNTPSTLKVQSSQKLMDNAASNWIQSQMVKNNKPSLTFGQRIQNMSPGLQQGLNFAGTMLGGLSGNELNPEVKGIREGVRSTIGSFGPLGAAISAATGVVDALGDMTGLNLDQIDKDSAERAGINTFGNNLINSIPGLSSTFGLFTKRTNQANRSAAVDELANVYSGTSADINAAMDLSGKRILGGTKKANSFIDTQNINNDNITSIAEEAKKRQAGLGYAQNLLAQNQTRYIGGRQNMAIGKNGMKLPSVYEIRRLLEITKFADGGKMNVIVEGAYHSRKNHLSDINPELEDVTPKGIPVITRDEGGEIVQTAEVEQKEMILHLELTEKLEALWKDGSEEAMIEAGKLLAEEIINNTDDKTGEVLDNE